MVRGCGGGGVFWKWLKFENQVGVCDGNFVEEWGLGESIESVKISKKAPYATIFLSLWACRGDCEEGVWECFKER